MTLIRLVPVLIGMLLMAAPAAAQSLAAVAKQEEARRERVEAPARAYTNADLVPDRTGGPADDRQIPAASGTGDTPEPTAADGADEDAVPADVPEADAEPAEPESTLDEAYWRRQAGVLRGRVERAREQLAKVSVHSEGNERQLAKLAELRTSAEGVLARAEATLQAFEREAQTLGVPAEWIR